jgi:3-oxoacyl-[acyl-carrier protein] reductase
MAATVLRGRYPARRKAGAPHEPAHAEEHQTKHKNRNTKTATQKPQHKNRNTTERESIMSDTIDTNSITRDLRVALVTGGSGGIGRAVVERLAQDGIAVGVHYAGNKTKADETVAAVIAAGGRAIAVGGDVADEDAMSAAFDAVEAEFGGIDVVVNTAGIMILSPIATLNLDDLDRMHRTNVRGTFVVSQQAARRVRAGGAIINFSTSVTRTQFPTYGAYVASKAAVESMTLILARELRGKDVTVNAVAPGPTATSLFLDGKDEATIATLSKAVPLERLGQPGDIAETVAFLAGPARWVNGQVIFTNGGLA